MSIVKFIEGKRNSQGIIKTYKTLSGMKKLINYIANLENRTSVNLIGGKDCIASNKAYEDFVLTKTMFNKLPENNKDFSKRLCRHFVQSFKTGEVSPKVAKEIADELVYHQNFDGFQIVYAVHTNTETIHTHFVLNTTNIKTGKAWQQSKAQLEALKKYADYLCKKRGLSITAELGEDVVKENKELLDETTDNEYWAVKRSISWKKEMFKFVKEARNNSTNPKDFIKILAENGITVRWTKSRKDITFINADGKKINSDKLGFPKKHYTPFTKDNLMAFWLRQKELEEVTKIINMWNLFKNNDARIDEMIKELDLVNPLNDKKGIAHYLKGLMFLDDNKPFFDVDKAVSNLRIAAQNNNLAQYKLACLYLDGNVMAKNYDLGIEYLKQAMSNNNFYAYIKYSKILAENGKTKEAEECISCVENHLGTYEMLDYLLGINYLFGSVKNPEKGLEIMKNLADAGNENAQLILENYTNYNGFNNDFYDLSNIVDRGLLLFFKDDTYAVPQKSFKPLAQDNEIYHKEQKENKKKGEGLEWQG